MKTLRQLMRGETFKPGRPGQERHLVEIEKETAEENIGPSQSLFNLFPLVPQISVREGEDLYARTLPRHLLGCLYRQW